MKVTIIAAIGNNNELGKNNDLIWHLPADLKRFKQITTGHHIIMGRKTYESIGKPLPNRTTIIITRETNYKADNCLIADSLEQALSLVKHDENPFIIGGAQIYHHAITLADELDICHVHENFDADVFFPTIDQLEWKIKKIEKFEADEKNIFNYSFIKYERIK